MSESQPSTTGDKSSSASSASPLQNLITHKAIFWVALILLVVADLSSKSWAEANTTRVVELTAARDLIYYDRNDDGGLTPTLMIDFDGSEEALQRFGQRFPEIVNPQGKDLQPAAESLIWEEDATRESREGIEFWPGILHFKWAENYGAAFSMGTGKTYLLALVSIGVLGIMLIYVFKMERKRWLSLLFLGMIAGGAIGNLSDRLTHNTVSPELKFEVERWRYFAATPTYHRLQAENMPNDLGNISDDEARTAVRDFLYWPFDIPLYATVGLDDEQVEAGRTRKWPIFNVADIGICTGVGGLILIMLLTPTPPEQRRKKKKTDSDADAESEADAEADSDTPANKDEA